MSTCCECHVSSLHSWLTWLNDGLTSAKLRRGTLFESKSGQCFESRVPTWSGSGLKLPGRQIPARLSGLAPRLLANILGWQAAGSADSGPDGWETKGYFCFAPKKSLCHCSGQAAPRQRSARPAKPRAGLFFRDVLNSSWPCERGATSGRALPRLATARCTVIIFVIFRPGKFFGHCGFGASHRKERGGATPAYLCFDPV